MKVQPFDFKRLIELAELVKETDYAKRLEAEQDYHYEVFVEEIEELKECEGNYDEDGYAYDDIAECVHNLIFADQSRPLPKLLTDLVALIYDYAVLLQDADMINNYGALYYSGRLGAVDYFKAEYYYSLASNLGLDLATENLGYIYYYGRTGKVDYAKAFMMFARGAAFDRPVSLYKLGDMYLNGYFVEKSTDTAFKLFLKAESLLEKFLEEDNDPSPDVYFRLGKCHYYGTGTDINLKKAFKYFQKAESGFMEKIAKGDHFVKELLQTTISLEEEIRKQLIAQLPQLLQG